MKAMLACSEIPDLYKLTYPKLITPKLDGIRALACQGTAMSRTLKPLPNKHVQKFFMDNQLTNLDGELMVRNADGTLAIFDDVQSAIMSREGEPDFEYWVFDSFMPASRAHQMRANVAKERVNSTTLAKVHFIAYDIAHSPEQAEEFAKHYLKLGYEGIIIRDPDAPYKHGRSTLKQEWMLKYKPFYDAEGVIVAYEELVHQDGYVGNKLGALWLAFNGTRFKVGSGFDDAQRIEYWQQRDNLLGKQVTFKYQELTKTGKPRFPVFKGIRLEEV